MRGIGEDRIQASAVQPVAGRVEVRTGRIPGCRIQRLTALHCKDGADLPASHDTIQNSALIEERLAFTHRKRVEQGGHESVRNVERGGAVVA